jgi:microsomal dipeptidase-like Zn-dependent dipeptidase
MTKGGVRIVSETMDLKIYIDLNSITNRTTKISVDVRKNIVLKDKATATAIIDQTERILVK